MDYLAPIGMALLVQILVLTLEVSWIRVALEKIAKEKP